MRTFKKLEWESLVTPKDEEKGIFSLKCWTQIPGYEYYITNFICHAPSSGNIFYLEGSILSRIEVKDIEEGKLLAQENFEKFILNTFFEQD